MLITRPLATIFTLFTLGIKAAAAPAHFKRSVSFDQVPTRLQWDHNIAPAGVHRPDADAADKYFHESFFHPHYDGRFGAKPVSYAMLRPTIAALTQSYTLAMAQLGVRTWLMHGALLGWWWGGGRALPWDADVDFMVDEAGLQRLSGGHNMTIWVFGYAEALEGQRAGKVEFWRGGRGRRIEELGEGEPDTLHAREYMLEINSHSIDPKLDKHNAIDARWIDMLTGLYIDITALRWPESPVGDGAEQHAWDDQVVLHAKDSHSYKASSIFPLRHTVFEGAAVCVPYAYSYLLIQEYGSKALTDIKTEGHWFDRASGKWRLGHLDPDEKSLRDVFLQR